MLPEEQIESIKKQLIQHVESTFPEETKDIARRNIETMNPEELEGFLRKNGMLENLDGGNSKEQCIFCSIVSRKIPSYPISEISSALAVLDINPISIGNSIIIPKNHGTLKKIPTEISSLASDISKKIKKEFSPKKIIERKTSLFNHGVLNLIPVYENETFNSERRRATKEELEQNQKALTKAKEKPMPAKPKKEKTKIKSADLWLPKRFP